MIENSIKEAKVVDNTQWKERHQFVLSANGNIICQRYFKVNGFNPNSLHSAELLDTVRDAVGLIKKDLVSKSRVYMGIISPRRTKLTGFYQGEELGLSDAILAYSDAYDGDIQLSNGVVLHKSYLDNENVAEEEEEEPFVFRLSYLFDDKVICEEVWDGTIYPKYIRNSVDLSNSNASYKYTDPMRMTFSQQMTKRLNDDRNDLIYTIIRMFCDTLSNTVDEEGNSTEKEYTSEMEYGDKTYYCTAYPREYVRNWSAAVRQKTIKYKRWVEWDVSQNKLDYINKYL